MSKIVFITGTDTDVGKTFVTTQLIAALRDLQRKVHAIKPIETGCAKNPDGRLNPADANAIATALGKSRAAIGSEIFYLFRTPVAPAAAAEIEDLSIRRSVLVEETKRLADEAELLIVEGAGGLLVPITADYSFADYAHDIGASVIVVVGSRLGVLNHALLSFEALKARAIPCLGYVFNDFLNSPEHAADAGFSALATNRKVLQDASARYHVSELCYVPYTAPHIPGAPPTSWAKKLAAELLP